MTKFLVETRIFTSTSVEASDTLRAERLVEAAIRRALPAPTWQTSFSVGQDMTARPFGELNPDDEGGTAAVVK